MRAPARSKPAPRARRRAPTGKGAARPARPPDGLSHEAICAAALRLIDQDGLAAFSTRKLGRALGCEAMAIYWYYPSKDELLDAVVDRLMARVGLAAGAAAGAEAGADTGADAGAAAGAEAGAEAGDWVAALRGVAHAYRQLARDHPKAFPLLATRRFASEGTYAFLERLFELARAQGIDDRTAARFYRVVSAYCNGFALHELAAPRGPQDPGPAALRRRFARVAAVWAWLEPRYLDELFDFGLELQLAALARTPRRARAR